jgi:hypothetical protein
MHIHATEGAGAAMSERATFSVGVRLARANGGGRLTIEKGEIVLEPDRPLRWLSRVQRIVHTDQRVKLVKARLVPPWFSTSVVLHDSEASGYAVTWIGARKRLRASLAAAGFDVQEITTWFSLAGGQDVFGGEHVPPQP